MVDVVLDGDGAGADGGGGGGGGRSPSRRRPVDLVHAVARSVHRHGRAALALGAGLVLVAGSAGAARVAEDERRAHEVTARLEPLDNTLFTAPSALSARWTPPSDLFSRLVTATDGLLILYAGDRTSLSAVDADSGVKVWESLLTGDQVYVGCETSSPADGSIACVVGGGGPTFALASVRVADGSEIARVDLTGPAAPYLLATDGADVLLVSTAADGSGTVTRRSPLDGTVRWTATIPAPADPPQNTGLGSFVGGGVVQLNGLLEVILDLATGAPVVAPPTSGPDDRSFVTAQALPDGGVALWRTGSGPTGDGGGVVRDPTGKVRFVLTVPPLAPRPDDGSVPGVLLLATGLSVDALDALTGEQAWHTEMTGSGISSTVRYDGVLDLAGSGTEGTVVEQHDLRTGDQTWSTSWDGVLDPQLFLAGDSLLVAGASAEIAMSDSYQGGVDRLALVDLRDGSLRELPWPTDLPTGSSFMILDHRLYGVTSNQGGLVQLG